MSEREENLRIGVMVSPAERQRLLSLKAQAGLPTLSSVVRLLIAQSDGILPPRVVGRSQRHTADQRAEYANRGAQGEAKRAAVAP